MKNKEELFIEVCNRYMFGNDSMGITITPDSKISLADFIKTFVEWLESLKASRQALGIRNVNFSFFNLTNQAFFYYPDFTEKAGKWESEQLDINRPVCTVIENKDSDAFPE